MGGDGGRRGWEGEWDKGEEAYDSRINQLCWLCVCCAVNAAFPRSLGFVEESRVPCLN